MMRAVKHSFRYGRLVRRGVLMKTMRGPDGFLKVVILLL